MNSRPSLVSKHAFGQRPSGKERKFLNRWILTSAPVVWPVTAAKYRGRRKDFDCAGARGSCVSLRMCSVREFGGGDFSKHMHSERFAQHVRGICRSFWVRGPVEVSLVGAQGALGGPRGADVLAGCRAFFPEC